ncbi:hypothetical protein BDP27DRAFT_1215895, partial [Rhodocollybia butyracea]
LTSSLMPFDERVILKTVVVLGGAYAGARAVRILSESLPNGWRIVLVDRNTHVNHVYIFPRLAVLSGHEHKGFVPFAKLLDAKRDGDLCLTAIVKSVYPSHVVLDRAFPERGIPTPTLHFDFLVYALGSKLPAPLDLWGSYPGSGSVFHKVASVPQPYAGSKQEGIEWLKAHQEVIRNSESILVVGGGALGIQFATDIAEIHPDKTITLLHSRHRLLPRFDERLHTEILDTLMASNVNVILGERLDMHSTSLDGESLELNERGQRVVKTVQGREVAADLILLCTGQKPNTHFLSAMDPSCVNPHDGLVHVLRTMQLGSESESESEDRTETTPYPNIFVVGDVADAFGAIPAGHTAYYQGEVAARNIVRLIQRSEMEQSSSDRALADEPEPLEHYKPGSPAIKVSLGLTKAAYEVNGVVGTSNDGVPDLNAAAMWGYFGYEVEKDEDMYF